MGMNNYLIVESLLVERLKVLSETDKTLRVLTADDAADLPLGKSPDRALIVMLTADNPKGNIQGKTQHIEQDWTVFCDVRQARNKTAAREKAGGLMATVLKTLMGFQFATTEANFNKLERVKSPYSPAYSNGYASYPLTFRTTFYFTT
jgi:hypothetical protein